MIINTLINKNGLIPWEDILYVSIIAIFIGFIATYFENYKLLNKFGRLIKSTKKYSNEDVWSYLHNAKFLPNNKGLEWVIVRDHKLNLMYYGKILSFSDPDKDRELVLTNVIVYDNTTGNELYRVDIMYVSRDKYELTLEIPVEGGNSYEKWK